MAKLRSRKNKIRSKSKRVVSRKKSRSSKHVVSRKKGGSRHKSVRKRKIRRNVDGYSNDRIVLVRLITQDADNLTVGINIGDSNNFNQFARSIINEFDDSLGLELANDIDIIANAYLPPLLVTRENFQDIKHDILTDLVGPIFIIRENF